MREKTTRYVLLGILSAGGPMTGYELRSWIDQAIGHFWSESFGQIYPELKRLADEGLIAPGEAASQGGREGKPYRITAKGRAVLAEWLARDPQVERVRSELLLKLFFGRFLGTETARGFLAAARDGGAQRAAMLEATARQLRKDEARAEDLVFSLLVIDRGLTAARAQRDWAARALRTVEALENGGPDAALATIAGG